MSITFLSNPIHLPEFFKFDREYLGKQESQNEDQKVFHKDTLEVSQLSKNRENLKIFIKCKGGHTYMSKLRRLMNRLSHGALTSVAALALTVTATNMNRCCWFIFGQDKLPDNAKKLRKF